MAAKKTKVVDVTPTFNYDRHVEIVKRFIEQLSRHAHAVSESDGRPDHSDYVPMAEMADYIAVTLEDVRGAVREIITDNIQTQIAEKRFPINPTLYLHPFEPYDGNIEHCVECDGSKTALAHVL